MPAFVTSAAVGLVGVGTGSTWNDRLREAAYTSPSGTRIKFLFENVLRSVERRGTVWEFAGVDEAYVQQKGFGARRYPLLCFFSGPDHDLVAAAFMVALLEPGIGTLEHPRYGKVDVVPFGEITQRDDLKDAANQSIFEVTFWTTLKDLYPRAGSSPRNEILDALGAFDVQAAQQFAESTKLATTVQQVNAKATIRGCLRDISAALRVVSDQTTLARREFDDTYRLVNDGLDTLVGEPLLLAQQISNLIKAPARAEAGIKSRLEGYADLAERIFGSKAGRPSQHSEVARESRRTKINNDFHISDMVAMDAVSGSVLALTENTFSTKPEALGAAEDVIEQFDGVVGWRDEEYAATGESDPGGTYQALQQSVALAVGYLIQVSFSLVPERRIVLDRPRTIIDVAAEIYGSVDDRLDFLISSNDLSGSEILELPRGRTIVYYPPAA